MRFIILAAEERPPAALPLAALKRQLVNGLLDSSRPPQPNCS